MRNCTQLIALPHFHYLELPIPKSILPPWVHGHQLQPLLLPAATLLLFELLPVLLRYSPQACKVDIPM